MSLSPLDQPLLFFVLALAPMWLAASAGRYYRTRRGPMSDDERDDLNLILTSALTLLALIIGFSFSMAVGRYDQRKNDEATEANTIETEYLRVGMLPKTDAQRVRSLLQQYVNERIATYEAGMLSVLLEHRSASQAIQRGMWAIVERDAAARPNSVTALIAQGMNDVIDAQGYAAAAWDNRIPGEAWALIFVIGIFCCALIGFDTKAAFGRFRGHLVLPLLIAISLFLIADLDSTHQGLIRVTPDNLIQAARSIRR